MATLKDIAAAVGTSIRTVSRALSGNGYVRADLRERILATAAALGYRPNPSARGLRLGRSEEVVVLASNVDELHIAKLAAIERTCRAAGLWTTMIMTGDETGWLLEELLTRRPVGVICIQDLAGIAATVQRELAAEFPVVLMDPQAGNRRQSLAVTIDRPSGVRDAVHHLAASGRRTIAYVGPPGSRNRTDGYRHAMRELGRTPIELYVPLDTSYRTTVRQLHAAAPGVDAVQVFSDEKALELLAGLHDAGIRVPQQIAVVGFDDRAAARLAWPPLSTVAQPNEAVGQAAARLAIDSSRDPGRTTTILVPTHLVVRESSKE
jgi:LacI family transcriptional regulator